MVNYLIGLDYNMPSCWWYTCTKSTRDSVCYHAQMLDREVFAPMAIEAYCVKCKAKKTMQDPVEGVTKNGKPITKGKCPD